MSDLTETNGIRRVLERGSVKSSWTTTDYQWAPNVSFSKAKGNSKFAVRTFTSDPKEVDTDDDGATDSEEYNSLMTDPSDATTYGLTRRHELEIEEFFESSSFTDAEIQRIAQKMGIPDASAGRRVEIDLTDATDDFDFVWQPRQSGIEKFVFTGLSGTERTDTWADSPIASQSLYGRVLWGCG